MKKMLLLCAAISAALVFMGCANQYDPTADTNKRAAQAPGSVAPISGGPARPGRVPQKFQP